MADLNIKDYTTTWITFGVLFFSLVTFASLFMAFNNPEGLGDSSGIFTNYEDELRPQLIQVETNASSQIEDSAKVQSENKATGGIIAASNSYGFWDSAKTIFPATKQFISFVFVGEAGTMIAAVFFGLMGFIALYFIFKLGRSLF